MTNNKRSVRRWDQTRHEAATSHGFLVWIAVYLVLTLTFLIYDHPGTHRAIASHTPESTTSAPGTVRAVAPGQLPPIARGS